LAGLTSALHSLSFLIDQVPIHVEAFVGDVDGVDADQVAPQLRPTDVLGPRLDSEERPTSSEIRHVTERTSTPEVSNGGCCSHPGCTRIFNMYRVVSAQSGWPVPDAMADEHHDPHIAYKATVPDDISVVFGRPVPCPAQLRAR